MDNIELSIDLKVYKLIVEYALNLELGARGLRAICEQLFLEALYNMPSNNSNELTLFENSVNDIINDELHNLYSELNTFMLEEGFFDSFKKIGKKLVNKIKDGIRRFYDNIIKKIINKLREYITQGIEKFSEILGIDINGSAQVKVSF